MRSDGSQRIKVTTLYKGNFSPTWSPDGNSIAYTSYYDDQIYVLEVGCIKLGNECDLIPKALVDGHSPDWSPTSDQIVFKKYGYGLEMGGIFLINVNMPDELIDISPPNLENCHTPRWSPDGLSVLLSCNGQIYIMKADGSSIEQKTKNGDGGGWEPRWSPDGSKITFISARDDDLGKVLDFEGNFSSNALYIMNIDGSNVTRLTNKRNEYIKWYAWLPDMK